ncbi:MAG TPA: cation-translocating P-type ATPase, partial [Bacillota bacterium]|nr:cation-translocating P-type ATPase [Bacillota bacterium]
MGSGTSVAREASDIILTDDNFSTITEAVRCGRGIYENLRKAIHFLLSCNIGELLTIFIAIVAGFPSPLNAVQLLWVNLVTDTLPAVALGLEKPGKEIMCGRHKRTDKIIDSDLMRSVMLEGLFIGIVSLSAFFIGYSLYGYTVGSTMSFAVLSLSQLFHAFNMKSRRVMILSRPFENIYLIASFLICSVLLAGVIM